MKLKNIVLILLYILLGGLAFWTPDVVLHARRAYEISGRDVAVITLLLPWTLLTCYGITLWLAGRKSQNPSVAIFMLIGVWLLGSTAMMLGASYSGGGFATSGIDVWYFVFHLPPYTFILSTHDGSLFGLILASALMLFMHYRFERHRWFLSKRIQNLIRSFISESRAYD